MLLKAPNHLIRRKGMWIYFRRTPTEYQHIEPRRFITISTKIRFELDPRGIRAGRVAEQLNREMFAQWEGLASGKISADQARSKAAIRRARSLGVTYTEAPELARANDAGNNELLARIDQLQAVIAALVKGGHIQSAAPTVAALLGGETVVTIRISALFDEYKLIAGDKVTGKSKLQMDKWSDVRRRAAERFCEVVGDKDLATVTKEDGRKFRDHWDRLVADKGLSHDTARLEMVKVQAMIKELGKRRGWELCGNLFEGLMPERREGDTKAIPFSVAWLTDKILPALATYENTEARNATYLAIETGMSPSEICNLDASMIKLDGPVPHIDLRNGAGTLKTANRRRVIPLVGVALEAMKQQRNGFAYGRDGAAKLSNEVSAFFDAKGLREHADNTALYSIRHSFKDRMRDAGIDHEMRNMLMGHSNKEERYGNGFVLAKKRDALAAMALPAHIG